MTPIVAANRQSVPVAKRTKEIIELNKLHYEPDNYTVIIKPGDKIQLRK